MECKNSGKKVTRHQEDNQMSCQNMVEYQKKNVRIIGVKMKLEGKWEIIDGIIDIVVSK